MNIKTSFAGSVLCALVRAWPPIC